MKHDKVIRREFSKQAAKFAEKGLTLSSQGILGWIIENLPLRKEFRVLDLASGTGHLSRAIAPSVRDVIAVDITREMLNQARRENTTANFDNIFMQEGSAESLPYQANTFDFVATRLSIHHFEKPIIPLREMVRVCKLNHKIGIIDLISPEDTRLSKTYNDLERLRDPSHTVALSRQQMETVLTQAGIAAEKIEIRNVEVDFQRWVQMTDTKADTVKIIRDELLREIHGGMKTGMRPFLKDGDLKFFQVWAIILGTKRV